jgi:hypothetical protein
VTIVGAIIDVELPHGGVGMGAVPGSAGDPLPSAIDTLAIRGSRVSITSGPPAVCIGVMNAAGGTGSAAVGEIVIEDSELSCAVAEAGGVGLGAGSANGGDSLSVGNLSLKNTTVVCRVAGGACIGGTVPMAILDGSEVDCGPVLERVCVEALELEVRNSLLGRTRAAKFFDVGSFHWDPDVRLGVKYLNQSEPEGITAKKFVHLQQIKYIDDGPYALFLDFLGPSSEVAMDGSEDGLLMAVPDSASGGLAHRGVRKDGPLSGLVYNAGGSRLWFGSGETMVANPLFEFGTTRFTWNYSPYHVDRKIWKFWMFTFLMARFPS